MNKKLYFLNLDLFRSSYLRNITKHQIMNIGTANTLNSSVEIPSLSSFPTATVSSLTEWNRSSGGQRIMNASERTQAFSVEHHFLPV